MCENMLMDEFTIEPRHQHRIQRPLQHILLPRAWSGYYTRGFVVMEFNRQIFREDILVMDADAVGGDRGNLYTQRVREACVKIMKKVQAAIDQLDSGRWDHDA